MFSNAKFIKKITNFFHRQNITIPKEEFRPFFKFMKAQYRDQNRSIVTPQFVFHTLVSYSKSTGAKLNSLLRQRQSERSIVVTAKPGRFKNAQPPRKIDVIKTFTRKKLPDINVTNPDGTALSAKAIRGIKPLRKNYERLSLTPVKVKKNPEDGSRAESKDAKHQFRRIMSFTNPELDIVVWKKDTPPKLRPARVDADIPPLSPDHVRLKAYSNKVARKKLIYYDAEAKKGTIERFEFFTTKEEVVNRKGAKRPCSQKSVMKNSSREIVEAQGELIDDDGIAIGKGKMNHRFHLGHRKSFGSGGNQVKENLDPVTAASNFYTLCLYEAPSRHVLLKKENPKEPVLTRAQMRHDKTFGLPEKSSYEWHNKHSIFRADFYPMSKKWPTLTEYELACRLMEMGDKENAPSIVVPQ